MQRPSDVTTWVSSVILTLYLLSFFLFLPGERNNFQLQMTWIIPSSFAPNAPLFFIRNIWSFLTKSPFHVPVCFHQFTFLFTPRPFYPIYPFHASISPFFFFFLFILSVHVLASINTGGLLHELSNEGARAQFEDFLESMILPAMVFSAEVRATIHFIHSPLFLFSVSYFFLSFSHPALPLPPFISLLSFIPTISPLLYETIALLMNVIHTCNDTTDELESWNSQRPLLWKQTN